MQLMNVSNEAMTMTTKEMASLTEKRHDSVKRTVDMLVEKGVIGQPQIVDGEKAANNVVEKMYLIGKRDSYVVVAQLSPEFTGRLVDRWQELEAEKAKGMIVMPNFANPVEAAKAWIEAYEKQQAAIALASHAIATKAEIGNRREATAMNTASQAVKKATALEIQLDRSKEYASIKRMEMLYHGQKFEWRKLKATGQEMGIEPIEIFDANYGTVKAYHKDVWRETYALDIE